MEREAEKILRNIIRLSELLDEETLRNISDLPFVELAKSLSVREDGSHSFEKQKNMKDRFVNAPVQSVRRKSRSSLERGLNGHKRRTPSDTCEE